MNIIRRTLLCLVALAVCLSGRLVWDSEVELSKQSPRHDIHVSGDGLIVLHDRLGAEHRVRFVDGKLSSPSCSPGRMGINLTDADIPADATLEWTIGSNVLEGTP